MATFAEWLQSYDPVPRTLVGESVYVIGGGPSLRNFNPRMLDGRKVIVTNEAFSLFPDAEAMVFVDIGWWQRRVIEIRETFKGVIIGRGPYRVMYKHSGPMVNVSYRTGAVWSDDPRWLGGKNSGLAALNAAHLMGADRAFLLGFDLREIGGRGNYHHLHDPGSQRNVRNRYQDLFLPEFLGAAEKIIQLGWEVINLTPGSMLKCFPEESVEWSLKKYQ